MSLDSAKTSLIGIDLDSADLDSYVNTLGCMVDTLPFNYLGFSIGGASDRKEAWNSLEERFRYKIDRWRNVSLSKGGKLTLTQSVLNSLPRYLFSLLQALIGAINKMEKIVSDFVRMRGSTKLASHLVKLDTTFRPIYYGGLGIGSFRQKNNALLTKWLWRFCKENNAFWRCLIVAIYGLEENGWSTKALNRGSFIGWGLAF